MLLCINSVCVRYESVAFLSFKETVVAEDIMYININ